MEFFIQIILLSHITHLIPRTIFYRPDLLISTLRHNTVPDHHCLISPWAHLQHDQLHQWHAIWITGMYVKHVTVWISVLISVIILISQIIDKGKKVVHGYLLLLYYWHLQLSIHYLFHLMLWRDISIMMMQHLSNRYSCNVLLTTSRK